MKKPITQVKATDMKRQLTLPLAAIVVLLVAVIPRVWMVKEISGAVRDRGGQSLPGATMRVKATDVFTHSDALGRFALGGFRPAFRVRVTAWKDGYYIGGADAWPWDTSVEIALAPYIVSDNTEYNWILPAVESRPATEERLTQIGLELAALVSFNNAFLPLAGRLTLGCRDCHGQTIYDQWTSSAHARARGNANLRFLSMYNGSDLAGNQSPPTRYVTQSDYGRVPLRPDLEQPYYGPGFKLDFPDSAGNCASCHLPTAAIKQPYGTDPNHASGVNTQGVHCDFCHKIAAVKLDSATGLPHENMPGTLSIELMRPSPEPQLFFGPYDDVDVGPDTYLPLEKQSEICAPCHNASFWGVPIYQSFAEWQASPYPAEGKTCQTCHMRPDGVTTNFAPGKGGMERDPETIPTHYFPGAADETLLQNTAEMTVTVHKQNDKVLVDVNVTNTGAGHHIPTDSPLRQILLSVKAFDIDGNPLSLITGPLLPDWTGDYKNTSGTYFAKILEELWTEVSPSGAYWMQTRIIEDTRLPALETRKTEFIFEYPEDSIVTIDASLIFRRAFFDIMQQKGWNTPDILMEQKIIELP